MMSSFIGVSRGCSVVVIVAVCKTLICRLGSMKKGSSFRSRFAASLTNGDQLDT